MANFALLIKQDPSICIDQIKEHLKLSYKSNDYMIGFLDGYLFDNYQVLTLQQYQKKVEIRSPSLNDCHLIFVEVKEKSNED